MEFWIGRRNVKFEVLWMSLAYLRKNPVGLHHQFPGHMEQSRRSTRTFQAWRMIKGICNDPSSSAK
jgi:hypothetical protein